MRHLILFFLLINIPLFAQFKGGAGVGYGGALLPSHAPCFLSGSNTGDGAEASLFTNPVRCVMHSTESGGDGFSMSGSPSICVMYANGNTDGFAQNAWLIVCPEYTAGVSDGYARQGMLEDFCDLNKKQLLSTPCGVRDNGHYCNKFTDVQTGEPTGLLWAADGIQHTLWFELYPPSSGMFAIETINSDFDTQLALYEVDETTNCPTCQIASAESGGVGTNARLLLSCLDPTKKYYLQLDGRNGSVGTTDIRISDVCPTPSYSGYDDCNNSPTTTAGVYNFCITPNGSNAADPDATALSGIGSNGNAICGQSLDIDLDNSTYFPVQLNTDELFIDVTLNQSLCGNGFSVMVFQSATGNCPAPNEWGNAANPMVGCFQGNGLGNVVSLENIVPNTTYYVLIDGAYRDGGILQLYISSVMLPLSWLNFDGERRGGKHWLYWQTGNEENVSHFEVERSANGLSFDKLGEVRAVGNSNTPQSYTFIDDMPLAGLNYYQIRQVDNDGQWEHSRMIVLNNDQNFESSFSVYPNPALDDAFVQANRPLESPVRIELYDLLGRKLISQMMNTPQESKQQILIGHLAAGVYWVKVKNDLDHVLYQCKLVKQTN